MVQQFKLSAEQIADLQQAQRALHDLLPEFDKAEECGIDCQGYRSVTSETNRQIGKMLEYYGTGRT